MMKFKVKWGDLKKEFTRTIHSTVPSELLPIKLYFESEESIFLFLVISGTVLFTEIKKNSINVDNFKMEFLTNVMQILSDPFITQVNINGVIQ